MPEVGGGARLSDLEARWQVDRSPRVFLQLADELRRTGALARAVEVLREGLSHHPESLSGRVALGRAELEAGDALAAAETFERVLARDPAQIVASKLLIEAWIRIGDAARARERLDIYRILQERDVEIGAFERRIAAMERSERMSAVIELAAAAAPVVGPDRVASPEPSTESSAPAEAPLFDLGAVRELPPLELLSAPEARPRPFERGAKETAPRALDVEMPFGTIHEPAASNARILGFFRTEALFFAPEETTAAARQEIEAGPKALPATAEGIPLQTSVAGETAFPEEIAMALTADAESAAASAEAGIEVAPALELSPTSGPAPAEGTELAGELAPGMTFEQFSTTGFAAEVERESLVGPLSDVLPHAGIDGEALRPIVSPAVEPSPAARDAGENLVEPFEVGAGAVGDGLEVATVPESGAESTTGAAPPPVAGAPSATLARLYLDQGHLAEAEAEFRRVLQARPDDEAAAAGLRELVRRKATEETVSGWAAAAPGAPAPPRPHRGVGLTQRKVETLRDYLERLRRSRARANVS